MNLVLRFTMRRLFDRVRRIMNRYSFGKSSHCRRGPLGFIGAKAMVFGSFLNQDQISGSVLKTLVFWSLAVFAYNCQSVSFCTIPD